MHQKLKKRYPTDNPNWQRLKGLWIRFKVAKRRLNILESQKLARQIQECQMELKLPVSEFKELFSIILWE
jgi:hypothetical protein